MTSCDKCVELEQFVKNTVSTIVQTLSELSARNKMEEEILTKKVRTLKVTCQELQRNHEILKNVNDKLQVIIDNQEVNRKIEVYCRRSAQLRGDVTRMQNQLKLQKIENDEQIYMSRVEEPGKEFKVSSRDMSRDEEPDEKFKVNWEE